MVVVCYQTDLQWCVRVHVMSSRTLIDMIAFVRRVAVQDLTCEAVGVGISSAGLTVTSIMHIAGRLVPPELVTVCPTAP